MTIQTDRLILREMTEDDFDSLYAVLHIEQQWLMDVIWLMNLKMTQMESQKFMQ